VSYHHFHRKFCGWSCVRVFCLFRASLLTKKKKKSQVGCHFLTTSKDHFPRIFSSLTLSDRSLFIEPTTVCYNLQVKINSSLWPEVRRNEKSNFLDIDIYLTNFTMALTARNNIFSMNPNSKTLP
jgi:hypothetical protein